jgi:hypothetical protein
MLGILKTMGCMLRRLGAALTLAGAATIALGFREV